MDIQNISPYIRVATRSQTKYLGWEIKERVIFDYELQYIKKGRLLVNIEGREYVGEEGDLFLYKPKERHTMRLLNNDGLEQPHIHFDFYYKEDSKETTVNFRNLHELTSKERGLFREDIGMLFNMQIPNHLRLSHPKTFETLLFSIIEEFENKLPFYELKMKAKFIDLWTHIIRELYHTTHGKETMNKYVAEDVLNFLDHNWKKDISLRTLEEEFNFTKNYLIQIFESSYGITPMKYLQQKRLQMAKELLLIGKYTVSEISREVGYSSVQAFSRAFKQAFHKSPIKFMSQ